MLTGNIINFKIFSLQTQSVKLIPEFVLGYVFFSFQESALSIKSVKFWCPHMKAANAVK